MGGHICVVARSTTVETLPFDPCCFHHHIGWRELNEHHNDGSLEPVTAVRELVKVEDGCEPDYVLEWLVPGRVLRYKREIPNRGLSSKYGTYLAEALRKRKKWAQALIADMRASRSAMGGSERVPGAYESVEA
jgi:hypothetical protein